MRIIPVILSGGSGTRLWPLSRKTYPKQFLKLLDEQSLFSATLERVKPISDFQPIIVSSEQHRFMVAEQLRQAGLDKSTILLEPVARNTAPAIAAAAIQINKMQLGNEDKPLMLVLPADHNIVNADVFHDVVRKGIASAKAGNLVTFGIVPKQPETGFGYINASSENSHGSLDVAKFVEKPNLETAKQYLESGDYFWNSGMFLFSPDVLLTELESHNPAMVKACQEAVQKGVVDLDFVRLDEEAFAQSPEDSIDYAVMEKTSKAVVVPLDAGWSDVGSWPALADIQKKDENGNAIHGDVVLQDTHNCMVYSENRLVSAIGVEDLVVVETLDAVLVTTKSKAQEVGKIVKTLKINERTEATAHRKIYRPWGNYDSIDSGERFQVKRITVLPGAELSLQKHFHRAEHWIVVSGTAEVTCDENVMMLHENQSTYIPLGSVHRLANRGKIPLELIEVQSGSYLGEDDIVRLQDNYGRSGTNT